MLQSQRSKKLILLFSLPKFKFITTRPQIQPESNDFSYLLHLCKNPHQLRQIHTRFILHGLHQNPTLASKLIETYSNLGCFNLSQQVFDSFTNPNTIIHNASLRSLYKFGECKKIVMVYQEMVLKSVFPDENSYPFVLRACLKLSDFVNGKKIHGLVLKLGFDSYGLVGEALEDLYSESDSPKYVHEPINENPTKSPIDWNSLIFESYMNGKPKECFSIFERMRMERVELNSVTLINLLRASFDLNSIKLGRLVHGLIVINNLFEDMAVSTALMTMYSKLGCLHDVRLVFDKMPERDCVVWNLMISTFARNGYPNESLVMLNRMIKSGIRADLFTSLAAISSITDLKSLKLAKEFHAHVIRNGSDYQISVHNSLIEMYCKCNCINYAKSIFDLAKNKTLVSWSSMIKGYTNHGESEKAFSLYANMQLHGFKLDSITLINVLQACVNIGALEKVKNLHGYSIKHGFDSNPSVNTSLLVSYAKCGCIEMAGKLFDDEEIDSKDIITWNSMINSYSKHGDYFKCFGLYNQMKEAKLKPDKVTFLSLLSACVNSGSAQKGWHFFKEMTKKYGLEPDQEHYACMVDLLGRSGLIKEAWELINSMPFDPDSRVWGPLLSACKKHSEPSLAEFACEKLIDLEPENAGNYVLLSNIYAAAGKWDGVSKMRVFLRDRGLKKTPGCSWLQINGKLHEFRVADKSHLQSVDIYGILRSLELEIKEIRELNS